MKNHFFALIIFVTFQSIFSQNTTLTIRVNAQNVNENEIVFISGNSPQFGNWQPNVVSFDKISKNNWQKTFEFPNKQSLEFKFTKGNWNTEALDSNGNIGKNNMLNLTKDTLLEFTISQWKDSLISYNATSGQITGQVEYLKNMDFEGILPRDVIIWLPPSYNINLNKRYPVFYLHDGQNLFDPKTSSFGIDWAADETADSLISQNKIHEIIIVGIYNTTERSLDYAPGEKGTNYMNFIVNKLKPLIDNNYRTLPDRENTAVGGSSMGGLISFMLGWEHDDIFSKVAAFSPAFVFGNLNYVNFVTKTINQKRDVIFYIDNGGKGLEEVLQPGIDKMLEILYDNNYNLNENLYYIKDYKAEHFESAWANRFHYPLIYFFKNK